MDRDESVGLEGSSVAQQVAEAVGAVPLPERPATPPPVSTSSGSALGTPPQQIRSSAPSPSDSPAAGPSGSSARPQQGNSTPPKAQQQASSSSSPSHQASSSSSGASSSPVSTQGNARRVKLYRLQDDAWIDLGTGNCAVHFHESSTTDGTKDPQEGAWIIVKREQPKEGATSSQGEGGEAGEMILRSKVMPYPPGYLSDDEEDEEDELQEDGADSGRVKDVGGYQRQQDTLIVWTDRELEMEMALSFATSGGCREIWDFVRAARKWARTSAVSTFGAELAR